MKPDVNHLPVRLIFVRRRIRTGILRAPAAGAQVWIARNDAAPSTLNKGFIKNTFSAPSPSLDLPHSSQGAAPDGAFLRSLSRPNLATGWFHPATPLPDAEVSFRMENSSTRRAWSSVADLNRHSQLGRLVC